MPAQQLYAVNVEGAVARDGRYLLVTRGADEDHAPGTLGFPGGTVEGAPVEGGGVLVDELRREVREEVGLAVREATYVRSTAFVADDGTPVVNVVFLCEADGDPEVADPAEVADVQWLTPGEVADHPDAEPWTTENARCAEAVRRGETPAERPG